jgi:hypothetical protein
MNPSPNEIKSWMQAMPVAVSFRPCAFFDDRMDCIRVIAKDCSVLEERINDRLTVMIDNYPTDARKKYVGFIVKGARHFCKEHGLSLATLKLTEVADALLRGFPDSTVMMFVDFVARPLIEDDRLDEVEYGAEPLAA